MTDILANGLRLHFRACEEGTPLVLTHGFGVGLYMRTGQPVLLSLITDSAGSNNSVWAKRAEPTLEATH